MPTSLYAVLNKDRRAVYVLARSAGDAEDIAYALGRHSRIRASLRAKLFPSTLTGLSGLMSSEVRGIVEKVGRVRTVEEVISKTPAPPARWVLTKNASTK